VVSTSPGSTGRPKPAARRRLGLAWRGQLAVGAGDAARALFHQVGRHARFLHAQLLRQARHAIRQEQRDGDEQRAQEVQPELRANTVSQLLAPLTMKAPMMGPTSVARPPTAAQIAISIELAGLISPGLMMPTCGTYSAPATPHIMADSVQIASL
jgi:hypothetical protein